METIDTWEKYPWPKWVPKKIRRDIEEFWALPGRSPLEWCLNGVQSYNKCPPFGALVVTALDDARPKGRQRRGLWIHCRNNMGRVILKDGTWLYKAGYQVKAVS
jgi:hypothetical protein